MRKHSYHLMVFLVLITNIIPPLGIDEYTPSLPHMILPLNTTASMLQLSVTIYMLAFAISQIICGSLSDAYGRRPIILWTVPLFLIGSLICVFATSMDLLMLGRFIQGAGVGALALSGPAIMADSFTEAELPKVSGYYSTVYSFIPISAPVIGGFLQSIFNWQANFWFMLVLGIIIMAVFYIKLPETHPPEHRHPLSFSNVFKSYLNILSHRGYVFSVLAMTFVWSMFIIFSIMAPFLIQNKLGFQAHTYGLLALLVGLAFFAGNLLNNFLLKFTTANVILPLGMIAMTVFSVLFCVVASHVTLDIAAIMVPVIVIMIATGTVFGHLYANAVSAVPKSAGLAGALIGSIILLGTVIITYIISYLDEHSLSAFAAAYLITALLALVMYRIGKIKS